MEPTPRKKNQWCFIQSVDIIVFLCVCVFACFVFDYTFGVFHIAAKISQTLDKIKYIVRQIVFIITLSRLFCEYRMRPTNGTLLI